MAVVLGPSGGLGMDRFSCREQEIQSRLTRAPDICTLQPNDIHVLLVDDEQLSRLVVGNLLRKCNYKVTVVESGPHALEILRRSVPGTFQLILTVRDICTHVSPHTVAYHHKALHDNCWLMQDVMMPEVDGLELLRYVRSNNELTDLPVISEYF
eukprot:jgi/Chrzof1/10597/Cz05g04240.t1